MLYLLGTIKAVNRNDRCSSTRDVASNVSNAQIAAIPALARNGSTRPFAALQDRPYERAGSAGNRSLAAPTAVHPRPRVPPAKRRPRIPSAPPGSPRERGAGSVFQESLKVLMGLAAAKPEA